MKKLTLLILLFLPSSCKADVYQKVLDRSVVIHIKFVGDDFKMHRGICSGTYIDATHLLSAGHCFAESPKELAWSKDINGQSNQLEVVKIDTQLDLVLLHVIGGKHHAYAKLGHKVRVGQPIIACGSPLGLNFMVSNGIVSKLDLHVTEFTSVYTLHTAMINPGSSGGGVFDIHGRLVGVNTMTIGEMPFGWSGISAAVDLETVRYFLYGR